MIHRRELLQAGLSAAMLGLLRRSGYAGPPLSGCPFAPVGAAAAPPVGPFAAVRASRPWLMLPPVPESVMVGDLPFAPGFTGDAFPDLEIPFHVPEAVFPGGVPPEPRETVDIAIVGGGLSGLTAAYLMREKRPVIFELHPRFGGVSQGEVWQQTPFSLGGAYFITPDKGDFLESFYAELGLDKAHRLSEGDDVVELAGQFTDIFAGRGLSREDWLAFQRYGEIVNYYAREAYPEIPLPERDYEWIVALDTFSLKEDIEKRMDMPVPPILAAAIQAYCLSSFNLSWGDLSAASGWNFIAAEEFGRWVCPGGNSFVVDVLWRKLIEHAMESREPDWQNRFRPGTRVVQVQQVKGGLIQVSYRKPDGAFESLLARRVLMGCSKHICKYMLPSLITLDPARNDAMNQVTTNPYVVANVLLEQPVELDFYDIFLLGDGRSFPLDKSAVSRHHPVIDALSGDFALRPDHPRSVLTLYWPLSWGHAVFELVVKDAWANFAAALAPQVHEMLELFQVPARAVRQVRMTRWGHSMPLAHRFFISSGAPAILRAPYQDHIYFANQDNWALPAFETSVLEAKTMSDQILASL